MIQPKNNKKSSTTIQRRHEVVSQCHLSTSLPQSLMLHTRIKAITHSSGISTPSISQPLQPSIMKASIDLVRQQVDTILHQTVNHIGVAHYFQSNIMPKKCVNCCIKNTFNLYCFMVDDTMLAIIEILEKLGAIHFKRAVKYTREHHYHYGVNYIFKTKMSNRKFKKAFLVQMNRVRDKYVQYRTSWDLRFNNQAFKLEFDADLYYLIMILESK